MEISSNNEFSDHETRITNLENSRSGGVQITTLFSGKFASNDANYAQIISYSQLPTWKNSYDFLSISCANTTVRYSNTFVYSWNTGLISTAAIPSIGSSGSQSFYIGFQLCPILKSLGTSTAQTSCSEFAAVYLYGYGSYLWLISVPMTSSSMSASNINNATYTLYGYKFG